MNKKVMGILVLIGTVAGISFKFNLISMSSGSTESNTKVTLGERPKAVQKAIKKAFENVSIRREERVQEEGAPQRWGLGSGTTGFYYIMNIDDYEIIKDILTRPKDNIYLMDVGAGEGMWGRLVMKIIKKEFSGSKKHFHIISVTGGTDLSTKVSHDGNTTLYEFGKFKIEDIKSELEKHDLDLTNKIDLIVSNLTLQHLVDPVGTLKQFYSLLTPDNGMLLSSGFTFILNEEGEANSHYALWKEEPSFSYLVFLRQAGHFYDFLLIKKRDRLFDPLLEYTGKTDKVDSIDSAAARDWRIGVAFYKSPVEIDRFGEFVKEKEEKGGHKIYFDKWILDNYLYYRTAENIEEINKIMREKKWGPAMRERIHHDYAQKNKDLGY